MRVKKGSDFGVEFRGMTPLYKPKTENQKTYVNHLLDSTIPIVLGIGPAGSGKTLFACNSAVMALKKGEIQKIILTRPVVPVEEDIGFLPGNLIHKMDPWTRPIFDILLEYYTQKDIDSMLHGGVLEISPLAFMRGRTFKNAFIIADEMQNSSPNQMLMLTTRIGDASKLVITGDLQQSDRSKDNGLLDIINKLKKYEDYCFKSGKDSPAIRIVEMGAVDIQRSPIVSKLLEMYGEPVFIPKKEVINLVNNNSTLSSTMASSIGDAALLPITQAIHPSKYPWEPKSV
jgi:phosphate starvation-inducible PhoH-like protein